MNFSLRTGFLCLCIAAGLGACCTKMNCDNDIHPEITVYYRGFAAGTLGTLTLYMLDKDSGTPVDSSKLTYFNGTFRLSKSQLRQPEKHGLKDYDYVLVTGAGTNDTIRDVTYQEHIYDVACNKCVLADGSVAVRGYKDFQFRHEGRLYQDADTLRITK